MLSLISTIFLVSFIFPLDITLCVEFSVILKLIQEANTSCSRVLREIVLYQCHPGFIPDSMPYGH